MEADEAVAKLTKLRIDGKDVAGGIQRVVTAAEQLAESGLTRRGLVILLQNAIGDRRASKTEINLVLDALPKLSGFLEKETK